MKIRMNSDRRGSVDGFNVKQYHKDCVYDLPDTLARKFIYCGYAEIVHTTPPVPTMQPQKEAL